MLRLFYIEYLKTHRMTQLLILLLVPLFFTITFIPRVVNVPITGHGGFEEFFFQGEVKDPWKFFLEKMLVFSRILTFIFPLIISIMGYMLGDMEHRANAWKMIRTFPLHSFKLIIVRLSVMLIYFSIAFLLSFCAFWLIVYCFYHYNPKISFEGFYFDYWLAILMFVKIYLCCLSALVLSFWLGLFFKNWLIVNIAVPTASLMFSYAVLPYSLGAASIRRDIFQANINYLKNKLAFGSMDVEIIGIHEVQSLVQALGFFVIGLSLYRMLPMIHFYKAIIKTTYLNFIENTFDKDFKNQFNSLGNSMLLLIIFISYVLYNILYREYIENHEFIYDVFSKKFEGDKLYVMLDSRDEWKFFWIFFFSILAVCRIFISAFCIQLGNVVLEYKLKFSKILNVVLWAECIFVLAAFAKLLWFLYFQPDYTWDDLQSLHPFSLVHLTGYEFIPPYLVYPFSMLNIFHLLYIIAAGYGLSLLMKKNIYDGIWLMCVSYGLALVLWLSILMLLQI